MKTKAFLALLIAILLTLTVASGCLQEGSTAATTTAVSSQSGTKDTQNPVVKVRIRYAHCWGAGPGKGQAFSDMLAKFKAEHLDILELEEETSYSDELREKIKVDVASNNLADLFNFWGYLPNIQPFVENGMVAEISEYLQASGNLSEESFDSSAWDLFRYTDGKVYGIPLEAYNGYFLVNRSMFDQYSLQLPETYPDLLDASKVFVEHGIIPFAIASKGGNPGHLWFSQLYMQYDTHLGNTDMQFSTNGFQEDIALHAARLVADMKAGLVFPKDTIANGDWGPSFALYNEGRAAMMYLFTWQIPQIKPEIEEVSVLMAPPRMPEAVNDPAKFSIGGCNHGVLINKRSYADPAKKPMITKLLDFISSDEMFVELGKTAMIPAKKGIILDSGSVSPIFESVMDRYLAMPHYVENSDFFPSAKTFDTYLVAIDELFAGSITPESFVAKIKKALIADSGS